MQTAVSDKLQFVAGWLTTPFRGIDKLKFVGLGEIGQQSQALRLALLRMKLNAANIVVRDY